MFGARVIAIDVSSKKDFCLSVGAEEFVDCESTDQVERVIEITKGGAHGVTVLANSVKAYKYAANMVRTLGTLSAAGIPSGASPIDISIGKLIFKGIKIVGCLVGSLKEHYEAVELTRTGVVKPVIQIRKFEQMPQVFEDLEAAKVQGRIVVKISDDE